MLSIYEGRGTEPLVLLPLVAAACAAGAVVLLLACAGSAPAIAAFVVVLVFVNDAVFRERDPGDLGLDWQNAMKFVLWAGAAAIGMAHLGRSWRLLFRYPVVLVLVYVSIGIASSLYSAAASYSFSTAFGLLAMLLLAGALVATLTEKQILLSVVLSLWVFMLVGWVVYFANPNLGRSISMAADGSLIDRVCGLAGQANALGGETVVSLAFLFVLWYRGHCRPLVLLAPAATSVFTLLATDSRTSLLAVLIGIAAVIARRSLWTWGSTLLGATLGVMVLTGVPLRSLLDLTSGLSRGGDPTEILTLTGRTEIWAFAWDRIVESPWIGYGYNSSKFILPQFLGIVGLQVDEAHNMWLQNLLGTGIIGTVPLAALALCLLVDYVRAPNTFRDLFLFILLVWGISDGGALGGTPMVMTLAVFLSLLSGARSRVTRSSGLLRPAPAPTYWHARIR